MPYYTEFLEVEQSYIWLKPVKEQLWSAFSIPFELLRAS
jgi:hypothetical protein